MVQFSVPISGTLTKPSGWTRGDDDGFLYFVFRYHMFFKERQSSLPPKMGERFEEFSSPTGASTKVIESITTKETAIDFHGSLLRHYTSSEQLDEISTSLAAKLDLQSIGGFSSTLKSKLTAKLEDGLTKENTINRTIQSEITHTITIERNISDLHTKKYVVPALYQQWCLDGYISHVDYLFVLYQRSGLQIRRRRSKYPAAQGLPSRRQHQNVIKMDNLPFACIKYWRTIPRSRWVEEREYRLEVEYPNDVSVHKPERAYRGMANLSDEVRTLYDLSEDAFPRRFDKEEILRRSVA